MKKIISILALFTIFMCGFSYAEEVDTNRTIKVNKYITDSLDEYYEVDYFKFNLSKKGRVQIEFEFDVEGSYYVQLYDLDNNNKLIQSLNCYTNYNTTSGEETFFGDKLRLPSGDYRIRVSGNGSAFSDENYKIRVNYESESKGNYEKEDNNDAKNAMEIDTNETVVGNLQSNYDVDFYMVDLSSDGTLQLNLEYYYEGAYNVVLYKTEGNNLREIQFNTASTQVKPYGSDYFNQAFDRLRLEKGTYYIKVYNRSYSNEDYQLSTYYSSEKYGNFEKESNDEAKNATQIVNNTNYIGNLSSNRDVDYYVAYIAKGDIRLEFEIPEDSRYYIDVFNETANGQLVRVTSKEINDENKIIELEEIKESGRYYFKIGARTYSNEDYKIKYVNNIYVPVINPNVTIDLQIGNQYMNVNGVGRLIDNNGTTPVLSSGRTMLPIRAVIETLGGIIEWDENTFTTTVKIADKNIKIKIGDKVAYVNGTAKTLDVPAQLINKRTMLPLRFVMENLGADVSWDDNTQIIVIKR